MAKAVASLGATEPAVEQGAAFQATFSELLTRVKAEPAAYGQLSLAGIFEMREECLRAFQAQPMTTIILKYIRYYQSLFTLSRVS